MDRAKFQLCLLFSKASLVHVCARLPVSSRSGEQQTVLWELASSGSGRGLVGFNPFEAGIP